MRGAQSVTADLSAHGMGQPKVLRARHAFVTGVRALRCSRGHLRGPAWSTLLRPQLKRFSRGQRRIGLSRRDRCRVRRP